MGTRLSSLLIIRSDSQGLFFLLRVCFFSSSYIVLIFVGATHWVRWEGRDPTLVITAFHLPYHNDLFENIKWSKLVQGDSIPGLLLKHLARETLVCLGFLTSRKDARSCWWPSWSHMGIAWWRMESTQEEMEPRNGRIPYDVVCSLDAAVAEAFFKHMS